MANGRHSYVRFFPSDWMAGTARLSRLHKSVYFDVCCYIWDTGKPCPPVEVVVMVRDLRNGKTIVNELVDMGKLVRLDDGSITNPRAMAEARWAFDQWEKRSFGGRGGRNSLDESDGNSDGKTHGKSGGSHLGSDNQNQNQNQTSPNGEDANPFAGEAWDAWIEMRRKARKVPTERAVKLAIAKLAKLRDAGHEPNDVLDQSTMNGWTGLFEIKSGRNGNGNGSRPSGWLS